MFADDVKIQRPIRNNQSCRELQTELTKLYEWSQNEIWNLMQKMAFGKSEKRPGWQFHLEKEKGVGVIISSRLTPDDRKNDEVRNMYDFLANMRVAFTYIMKIWQKK